MQVQSLDYDLESTRWSTAKFPELDSARTLVLVFGSPEVLSSPASVQQLANAYPRSVVVGCSSAGEIHGSTVKDHSLSVTVSRFDKTDLALASLEVRGPADSFATGAALAKKLATRSDLRGMLILSEGMNVNGSELLRGVNSVLDESVVVTGGLSGDGYRFKQTWVSTGAQVKSNQVAAVGFYGDYVQIGHGSKGGWDRFGPERVVTRSEANVLYELDGKPALALYKEYLGDKAKDLPASGLLFPLSMRVSSKDDKFLVRTLLAVDHDKSSLTFAGDIPKGNLVQLMRANFERLIGGASDATSMALMTGKPVVSDADSLAIAISCVGRRLVLGERVDEETEAVQEGLTKSSKAHMTGFYSYGEISPYASGHCDLHNQTMTLTVVSESPTPLPRKAHANGVHNAATPKNGVAAKPGPLPTPSVPPRKPTVPPATRPAPSPLDEIDFDVVTSNIESHPPGPLAATETGMITAQLSYDLTNARWSTARFPELDSPRTLVLAFGSPEVLGAPACVQQLASAYPQSVVVGCSSAGEIHGATVKDHSLSVTVSRFDKTDLQLAAYDVAGPGDSFSTGAALAAKLASRPALRGVLILSEGMNVNGSELLRGVNSVLDDSVVVTGGLSGDGFRFKQTWVSTGARVKSNQVAAVGFYGDHVQIGHGSKGGWDRFGPERVVTRSEANVLYELDGKPALALYKEYLGDKAKDLPASGLLFPLSMRASSKDDKFLVRTLLAVDHEKSSLTFAGDIPKGNLVQLMRANFERLIGGAGEATSMALSTGAPAGSDSLAIAISCVGRRLVLGERTDEEMEAVLEGLAESSKAHVTGFYSYGEISPYALGQPDLHNQTMTLTVVSESATPLPRRMSAKAQAAAAAAQDTTTPGFVPQIPRSPQAPAPSASSASAARSQPPTQPPTQPASLHSRGGSTLAYEIPVNGAHANHAPASPASGYSSSMPAAPSVSSTSSMPLPSSPSVQSAPSIGARSSTGMSAVPRSMYEAPTRALLPPTGAPGATIHKQKRGDITVLSIGGRLTEAFRGDALGRELRGTVVFDLAAVERITSFGVREWLAMLGAMTEVSRYYLVRCSEAVVSQLGMIRKFAGSGQIVSFFAPYLCQSCGEGFERRFDSEREAEAIRTGSPPSCACPRCGGTGAFDDDARTYFAFAVPHLNVPTPAEVRSVQNELDSASPAAPREAVEKTVEGNVTRVRVAAKLDASIRWRRIFDGIEGGLVVDLGTVPESDDAGAANLEQALRALGPEVTPIVLERVPSSFALHLARTRLPPRVLIGSANLEAFCPTCAVKRPALLRREEHLPALRSGEMPQVACKRCNAALELSSDDPVLAFLRTEMTRSAPEPASSVASQRPVVLDAYGPPDGMVRGGSLVPPAMMPEPRANNRGMLYLLGGGVAALLLLLVWRTGATHDEASRSATAAATDPAAATMALTAPGAKPTSTPAAAAANGEAPKAGWLTDVDLPPAWVERPFVLEGDQVLVVGKAVPGATAEAAMASARTDAIVRIVKQVAQDLTGSPVFEFVQSRGREVDAATASAVAARYLAELGTVATPERVDAALRKRESGVDGFARYSLTKAAYAQVVAAYKATAQLQGATVALFFPLLESTMHADGNLVVLSVARGRQADLQGIRPGDVITSVDGKTVTTVEALNRVATDEWAGTPVHGSMNAELESAGAKRSVRFYKPGPDGR